MGSDVEDRRLVREVAEPGAQRRQHERLARAGRAAGQHGRTDQEQEQQHQPGRHHLRPGIGGVLEQERAQPDQRRHDPRGPRAPPMARAQSTAAAATDSASNGVRSWNGQNWRQSSGADQQAAFQVVERRARDHAEVADAVDERAQVRQRLPEVDQHQEPVRHPVPDAQRARRERRQEGGAERPGREEQDCYRTVTARRLARSARSPSLRPSPGVGEGERGIAPPLRGRGVGGGEAASAPRPSTAPASATRRHNPRQQRPRPAERAARRTPPARAPPGRAPASGPGARPGRGRGGRAGGTVPQRQAAQARPPRPSTSAVVTRPRSARAAGPARARRGTARARAPPGRGRRGSSADRSVK